MRETVFCLRYLVGLSWQVDRRRLSIGGFLLLVGAIATPAAALALKGLVDGVAAGDATSAIRWALVGATALIAELMAGHFAHLYYFELAEITEETLNRKLLRIVNGSRDLEQCEDPAFADRVELLRQDVMRMRLTLQCSLQLGALAVQILLTAVLLATLAPLLLLLPVVAIAPVVMGKRAEQVLDAAREETAPVTRAISHLRNLSSSPQSQKEIQLSGSADYLVGRQEQLLATYGATLTRAYRRQVWMRAAGQLLFALAYVGSVLFVYLLARRGDATVGDVVLVVTLATQISMQMALVLQLLGIVHQAAAGLRRFLAVSREADEERSVVPQQRLPLVGMRDGITFEKVTFCYPGASTPALRDVDLHLPAGTAVALVGENGAGKSTFIKLLSGLYRPTAGRILVDDVDLGVVDVAAWRERTAALFQDFARLELSLQHSVGVGRLAEIDDREAVRAAVRRAGATAVVDRVGGPDAILGTGYADGSDLSGGQWQSVGFARTLMRPEPLLLSLDEPGSALDALAEQRMCDAYQATSRDVAVGVGAVTIFVTHRMSTVRLADLIVVLHEGQVVEQGTHDELVARGGRYAELFRLQSRAYAD